jgi:hypothetical protein
MTKRDPILPAAAILMLATAGATAGELPRYDVAGFPATPHQMSVLGQSGDTQEQPAAPTLLFDGMPASPLQIAVLTRRPQTTAQSARPIVAAESRIDTVTRSE